MYNSLKTKVKNYYLNAISGHGLPQAQYIYRREWMDAFWVGLDFGVRIETLLLIEPI